MTAPFDPEYAEKLNRILFEPLSQLFGAIPNASQKIYHDAFQGLTEDEMQKTYERMRDRFTMRRVPFPADIAGALRAVRDESRKRKGSPVANWQTVDREIDKVVRSYLDYFQTTDHFHRAQAAGYSSDLWQYVRDVAGVQAQMIHAPHRRVAHRAAVIFRHFENSPDRFDLERQWFANQHQQAKSGIVSVYLPPDLITIWETEASIKRVSSGYKSPVNRTEIAQNASAQVGPLPLSPDEVF
jgi:hypothetical protein